MIVHPMSGPFGAIAEGVDLARDRDEPTIRALIDALHWHQILVVCGQRLDGAAYVAFGRQFGTPLGFFIATHRQDDFPEMIHSATPIDYSDAPGKRRLLYRISTKGLPALYADVPSGGTDRQAASSSQAI